MTKLSDMQAILLSTASQRKDGHLLPLPAAAKGKEAAAKKSLTALLKKDLAAETHTKNRAQVWREEGEWLIGLVITQAGLEAIGATEPEVAAVKPPEGPIATASSKDEGTASTGPTVIREGTKQAAVIALLQREQGASIADIVNATGWLPHTTRAALTGLKKRGFILDKQKADGVTRYRITKQNARS